MLEFRIHYVRSPRETASCCTSYLFSVFDVLFRDMLVNLFLAIVELIIGRIIRLLFFVSGLILKILALN